MGEKKSVSREVQIERVLTVWGVIVILWSFYRTQIHAPIIIDEFIAKPLIFLTPIYIFLRRFYKTMPLTTALGFVPRGGWAEIGAAVFVFFGLLLIGLVTVVTQWPTNLFSLQWGIVLQAIVLALMTAFIEEIVARGFLYRFLVTYSGKVVLSFVLSALLFFVLYLPGIFTSGAGGQLLIYAFIINIMISIVATTLFTLRGSLWIPIAAHAAILVWFELLILR